jgi:hypothetical protein
MRVSRVAWIVAVALAAGCGKVAELKPAPGHSLPVKPMMARTTPTAAQLLTPPPNAHPERIDELMKKSEPRAQDPFDLPPPSGGAAPALPAGSDPYAVTNDTGPAAPK